LLLFEHLFTRFASLSGKATYKDPEKPKVTTLFLGCGLMSKSFGAVSCLSTAFSIVQARTRRRRAETDSKMTQ